MPVLPSGTVTFLFTDIEGSTDLLQRLGDTRYATGLAEQRRLLLTAVEAGGGQEVGTHGDACLYAFLRAHDAVAAAVTAQRAVAAHPWPEGSAPRVRMGVHTGEPVAIPGDYAGLDVHRAARICAAAHGGQILLSLTTSALIEDTLPPEVTLRDLGSHRLKDLQEPEKLFQVLHPDLPGEFPRPHSLDAFATNLPRPLTSFIGRDREIAEVERLLRTTCLLTLTGSGGSGKTRLALQVAAVVLGEYADGVWLVELAAVPGRALVPQTVASALGVREVPGRPLVATLLEYLGHRTLLVVLDNCEHLIEASAHLVQTLLEACPGLRILATSREPLGVPGEVAWRVPSLSLPDPRQLPSVEDLGACEAVRLFVERAAAVHPAFRLTPQNAPAVATVVQRLDGIPLAVELAAARIPALTAEQIAARLDDRFRLLTGGQRTALPRQQTLRAAMDWSYQLLSDRERTLLRRLSVFAGGWTLGAAEAVCGGGGIEGLDVVDLLTQLVFKSLVVMDEQRGDVRYRMLETVRQYGRDRLRESEDTARVRGRHLEWYRDLAEQAEAELMGAGQAAWLDRLEAEHANIRAGLEWAAGGREVEAGLRLAGAVWRFWFVRGYFAEGRAWLEALLAKGAEVAPAARAKALKAAGTLAACQGDYASGRSLYEESLALWRRLGDRKGTAYLLANLVGLTSRQGDHGTARALGEESLAIWRDLGDKWGTALALNNLGLAAYRHDDYNAARPLFEESLAIWRERRDKQYTALLLRNLGLVASRQGDLETARESFEEAMVMMQELGDKQGMAYLLEGFATLAAARGDAERAARLFGAADALREAIGAPLPPADRDLYARDVAVLRAMIPEATLSAAMDQGRAMTLDEAIREGTEQ